MAMAKVNRSQLVRDLLQSNPEMEPKAIVEALAKNGHKISANLVYAVKGAMAERKHRKKRVAKAALAAAKPGAAAGNGMAAKTDALTMIREVKALAAKAGGYTKLKELVDALAE